MFLNKSVVLSLFFVFVLSACSGSDGFGVGNGDSNSADDSVTVDTGTGDGDGTNTTIGSVSLAVLDTDLILTANGTETTVARVTVTNTDGSPLSGLSVAFTAELGTLSSATGTTNSFGVADVTLTSPTTLGSGGVRASASGITSDVVSVSFIAGPPSSVTLQSNPATVSLTGETTLTANITDANSLPVSSSSLTFFISTDQSGAELSGVTTTTDENGQGSVTYTAGSTAGTDTIGVRASNGQTGSIDIAVTAVTAGAAAVNSVQMFAGSASLAADGTSQTTIRATVNDADDVQIVGKTVSFTVSAGSFSGSASAVTDENGAAEVTLVSSTNLGGAVVIANSDGVLGTTTVQFVAGSASAITLSAAPSQLNFGADTVLSVEVKDAQGHPVSNELIAYSVSTNVSGGSLGDTRVTTDVNGRAAVTYTAGSLAGSDVVTVELANGTTTTQSLTVSASAAVLGSLVFSEPNGLGEITADGTSFTLLRGTVLDVDSMPVEGVDVSFVTSIGDFNSSASALTAVTVTTDSNGLAEVELYSRTTVDTAQITASVGGFNQNLAIEFVPGVADSVNSSISTSPASLPADGTSQTTVTVTLADTNGNPIDDGTEVTLRTTAGSIITTNPVQSSSGRAEFTLVSSSESGTATLSLKEVNGLTGAVSFGSNSDNEAANIILSAAQSGLFVAGVGQTENTTINISIVEVDGDPINEDNWGNLVNTARVTFLSQPNGGEFLSGVDASGTVVDTIATGSIDVVTTNGSAQVNLQAGTLPGVVEVQVEALDQAGDLYTNAVRASLSQVSIASGAAHTLVFSFPVTNAIENLNLATPRVPGFYRRAGGITVTDRYGNAVPDGTVINLGVTDSITATGTAGSVTAASSTLTDAGVMLADGTASTFDTAMVTRSGANRFIQENDRILVFDAQAEDKSRFVGSAATTASTVTAQSSYSNSQAGLDYVVGASLLGASVAGFDSDTGNLTIGRAVTKDGLAQIRFTYPADINSIVTGINTDLDTRVQPYNSGQVYLLAQSSDSGATVIDSSSAFSPISNFLVLPSISEISGSGTFYVEVRDGGDNVNLPFLDVGTLVFTDTRGTFNACYGPAIATEGACNTANFDWYSTGGASGICIKLLIQDETDCTDGGDAWLTGVSSKFDVTTFVGEDDSVLTGRIPVSATHTTRVPVDTDTDGVGGNDFFVHNFTNVSGFADIKVVVSGSPFLVKGDKATVAIRSGDGTGTVTVEIP